MNTREFIVKELQKIANSDSTPADVKDAAKKILAMLQGKKTDPVPPAPDPTPGPVPEPVPTPVPDPTPAGTVWKCPMFFPHKLCVTTKTPPWPGNSGVDSLLGFVDIHGNAWEKDARRNGYAWIEKMGGDTAIFIAEKLRGNRELAMFLTNCKHPQDGHRMNDAENEVVIARNNYGVNRWIVSLFNDDSTSIPVNGHEQYIAEITNLYDWASADQVAYMICLETNERFSVAETIRRVTWVAKYAPGKRIIVGSALPDFLKQVSASAKAQNLGVELWLETAWHPFQTSMANADSYLATLKDLQKSGPTWAGEFGNGSDPSVAYISKKAIEMGCVGVGSYLLS